MHATYFGSVEETRNIARTNEIKQIGLCEEPILMEWIKCLAWNFLMVTMKYLKKAQSIMPETKIKTFNSTNNCIIKTEDATISSVLVGPWPPSIQPRWSRRASWIIQNILSSSFKHVSHTYTDIYRYLSIPIQVLLNLAN